MCSACLCWKILIKAKCGGPEAVICKSKHQAGRMDKMKITVFKREHIEEANILALTAYEEERRSVMALPEVVTFPDMNYFADNGMGVAAFEEGKLAGFLCSTAVFDNAFGSTEVKGIFSPMWANGAAMENRAKIYAAMYQEAAGKWVNEGAVSHGICLYAHDETAQKQFFRYGFGLRCVDSIRAMEQIDCKPGKNYEFTELAPWEYKLAYPLDVLLHKHYCKSPFFMNRRQETCEDFCAGCVAEQDRCFAAKYEDKICAYLKISRSGETFITDHPKYLNITGAYCLEDHRGRGVYQNMLNYAVHILKAEGYCLLGVDFESFNPTAAGFWSKYFTAYTHSVVRRID